MSEQDAFETQKQTSKNGREYEVGPKKTEGGAVAARQAARTSATLFNIAVNWPVDDKWHNTTDDFANTTGITAYQVGNSSNIIYDYYIQITTNKSYDYFFTDASPDVYELNVNDTSSDHIVRYNSSAPTIINVTGG